jgi:phospholipase C
MIKRPKARALAAVLLVAGAAATGCGGQSAGSQVAAATPAAVAATTGTCGGSGLAPVRHVVWIVMENQAYGNVIGSRSAPYVNRLAAACGLATRFSAEAHPSLPNYIAMTSGSTQGISDDSQPSAHRLGAASLFSQLGTRWRALEESMPRACALNDAGQYAVRHNPATYYTGIRAACAKQDLPLTSSSPLTTAFTFVTPNVCHDMHSCPVSTGDRWLSGWLPRLLRTSAYRSGSTAVFITWDEDDGAAHQHIPMLVLSRHTRPGTRSATAFDHYSLLRTTEEILGLPKLGAAGRAASMRQAFGLA